MRIVIAGGSGHLGQSLHRALGADGHEIVVLSRNPGAGEVLWDARGHGQWEKAVDGADAVINLAGKSVNCRYTAANVLEMTASRIESTLAVGRAIGKAKKPPKVWLQASTATIYAHRFDAPNDEVTGLLSGADPKRPELWPGGADLAKQWEKALERSETPYTRKVAMRISLVFSAEPGGVFDVFAKLAKRGLGGTLGSGRQFVSWIHGADLVNAVRLLLEREDLSGPVNLASPNPLPNKEFQAALRQALGVKFGPPAPTPFLLIGLAVMGKEAELVLKSRRVVPKRLLDAGFEFQFPDWPAAARDLAAHWKS